MPLWLKRLSLVRHELRNQTWPATPEDGLRETLALADFGWRAILEQVRRDHPTAGGEELQMLAYRMLCRWQRVRDRLRFRPV
jgi:hypothetical protein